VCQKDKQTTSRGKEKRFTVRCADNRFDKEFLFSKHCTIEPVGFVCAGWILFMKIGCALPKGTVVLPAFSLNQQTKYWSMIAA
jgi:hypothetical protein